MVFQMAYGKHTPFDLCLASPHFPFRAGPLRLKLNKKMVLESLSLVFMFSQYMFTSVILRSRIQRRPATNPAAADLLSDYGVSPHVLEVSKLIVLNR